MVWKEIYGGNEKRSEFLKAMKESVIGNEGGAFGFFKYSLVNKEIKAVEVSFKFSLWEFRFI